MRRRTHRIPVVAFAFLLAAAAGSPVLASPADDAAVLHGYRTYYAGDLDGARGEFERLLQSKPADLAARFGLLNVLERRLREHRGEAPDFERRIDAFLADAQARYDRAESDSEALFYLANGHMARARYRFDYDRGMWGAARDGARAKKLSDIYVIAHMRFRQGEADGLAQEFSAVAEDKSSPDWLKAAALVQLGRVHDVAGRRADARKAYERVVDSYERESAAWPAKVGLVSAYQRQPAR